MKEGGVRTWGYGLWGGRGGRVTDFFDVGVDEARGCGIAFVEFCGGVGGYLVGGAELDVGFVEVG